MAADDSAPWVRTRFRFYDDDHPLTRASLVTSAGVYLTPLHALLVETELDRFTTGGARSGATVSGVLRGYWPGARLQTEVAAGVRHGTSRNIA